MSQSHKFPKRTGSKQTSGLFEPGPWLTNHWRKSHTKKATNLKFCYGFIGKFCSFLAGWQDFIVLVMPWMGYWSFRYMDCRGSSLSLWIVLNNKLQRKCACVREQERKKREKWKGRMFLISGVFQIGTNCHFKHDRNKWMWLPRYKEIWLEQFPINGMTWLIQKRKKKKWGYQVSSVFFSGVSCYHLNSMITKLLHVPVRIF